MYLFTLSIGTFFTLSNFIFLFLCPIFFAAYFVSLIIFSFHLSSCLRPYFSPLSFFIFVCVLPSSYFLLLLAFPFLSSVIAPYAAVIIVANLLFIILPLFHKAWNLFLISNWILMFHLIWLERFSFPSLFCLKQKVKFDSAEDHSVITFCTIFVYGCYIIKGIGLAIMKSIFKYFIFIFWVFPSVRECVYIESAHR